MIGKSLLKHQCLKKNFYSNLSMKDITDANYMYEKRVFKDFEMKTLVKYHDLYLKNDTLRLADVFEDFIEVCLKIYHLFPGLAWQAAL